MTPDPASPCSIAPWLSVRNSPCLGSLDVTPWRTRLDFPDCHYITVSSPSGGVGGFRSVNFSAFRTRRASGQPPLTPRRSGRSSRRNVTKRTVCQRLHRPLRREVDPRLLEPAIQEPLHQERQGGHKDMCLHSRLYLMIDRPHRQHVLELTEPPFDVAQVLVDRHHLEHAQTRLAGRNHIFTLDPLLAPQACRVLEVPEAPLMDLPGVVAVAVAPLQQPLGRGADLLGLLQLAGRYAQLQFLQRLARPLHRLHPHRLLIGARARRNRRRSPACRRSPRGPLAPGCAAGQSSPAP